jgi:ParB family chromosome partitioning protein
VSPIDFKFLPIDDVEPNSWNPNSMTQEELDRLSQEIDEVGFIDPIEVVLLDTGKYRILGGEHRHVAAKELGFDHIPCMVLKGARWQDEDLQKLVTVRLNSIKGRINPEKMAVLYHQMAKKYGEDALQNLFAFTSDDAWKKLVSQIKQGLSRAKLPPEKQREFSEKSKEAKTLQDLERILNELWASYGDTADKSFMIFTYGKREHIYVAMEKAMRDAMKKVMKHCRVEGVDINVVLGPAIVDLAKALAKKPAKKRGKRATPRQDDVEF